jgi:NADH-quinone oxidoreductase subunit C
MIIDTVKERLSDLLPPAPESPAAESPDETTPKTEPAIGVFDRSYAERGYHLDVKLKPDQIVTAAGILFELGFFLETITGVDWIKENSLEAVYDFSRYDFDPCRIVLRVRIPRTSPLLPTITGIYSGASWHERETHDFFGIVFDGHPHLIPLLLPEDADFHPLLKDFKA